MVNESDQAVGLEFVSSFFYQGISRSKNWEMDGLIRLPHNSWTGELQLRRSTPDKLGLNRYVGTSLKRICRTANGTWSTGEYLPMGMYEEPGSSTLYYWQIEHNGP